MWNPLKTYSVVCRERQKKYVYTGKKDKIISEFSHILNGYIPKSYKDLLSYLRTHQVGEWSYSSK